jgi:hypothetical protein
MPQTGAPPDDLFIDFSVLFICFGIFVIAPICACIVVRSKSPIAVACITWITGKFRNACGNCGNHSRVGRYCSRCGARRNILTNR